MLSHFQQSKLKINSFYPIFLQYLINRGSRKLEEGTEYLAVFLLIWLPYTMLQKLSKSEVKAWPCRNLILLLPFRLNVKLKLSKNVIFGNFWDSEIWILVNLGLESCSNLLNSKFRTSKIVKINIFGPFEFTKIWFHVK